MGYAQDLLEERFRSETFECRLKPLSDVIAECGVEWIDLLKIDVQKAELAVLDGIREEHWPGIGRIVLEVHDLDGRLERIRQLLRSGRHVSPGLQVVHEIKSRLGVELSPVSLFAASTVRALARSLGSREKNGVFFDKGFIVRYRACSVYAQVERGGNQSSSNNEWMAGLGPNLTCLRRPHYH